MIISRLSLALLSLLVISSTGDDSSKDGFDGIPDAASKYGFDGIPADSPQAKPEGEDKYHRSDTKPDFYKPKSEQENENSLSIGVQGLVLCKSGSQYYPIPGASAKILCKAVDEVGVEQTVSICSQATDSKGYFFAPLLSNSGGVEKLKLGECKAYLHTSPSGTCNVPTNVNKAIEGALLSAFRVLKKKKMRLYSVGPFFYTSETKSTPNAY